MKTIRSDIHIDAPVHEVHMFGQDPEKWEQWYVNLSGHKTLTGHGEEGTIVEAEYSVMGVHVPVKIEVVESNDHHWKGRITGAMEGDQIINVVEEGDGSHVEMLMHYSMTNKLMDKIADSKVAEKLIERSMLHSIENWKTMCEMKH